MLAKEGHHFIRGKKKNMHGKQQNDTYLLDIMDTNQRGQKTKTLF